MNKFEQDQIIILKKTEYSEQHYIVNAYGYKLRNFSFKAPYSRKITSYKMAHLNELNITQGQFYLGSKYYSLQNSQNTKFASIKLDLLGLSIKDLICHFLWKNLPEADPTLWKLLNYLNQAQNYNGKQLLIFMSKFLQQQGLLTDHPKLPKTIRFYLHNDNYEFNEKLKLNSEDCKKSWEILQNIAINQLNYQVPKNIKNILAGLNIFPTR